jgi:hypothetical protein
MFENIAIDLAHPVSWKRVLQVVFLCYCWNAHLHLRKERGSKSLLFGFICSWKLSFYNRASLPSWAKRKLPLFVHVYVQGGNFLPTMPSFFFSLPCFITIFLIPFLVYFTNILAACWLLFWVGSQSGSFYILEWLEGICADWP